MERKFIKITNFREKIGYYLVKSQTEPVYISRSNKPCAVLIDYNVHEELMKLYTDQLLLEKAQEAKEEPSLPIK